MGRVMIIALLFVSCGVNADVDADTIEAPLQQSTCHWTQECADAGQAWDCTRPHWTCPPDGGEPAL